MKNLSRRCFLVAAAMTGVAALGACSITTSGTTTTITVNVEKIEAYSQAGLNAAATVISLLGSVSGLAPYITLITAAETALSSALSAFSSAVGSTVTVSYDDASWKTRIDSLLSAIETVASTIAAGISAAGSAVSSTIQSDATTALSALKTITSVFTALLSSNVSARRMDSAMMSEAQALQVLGVAR